MTVDAEIKPPPVIIRETKELQEPPQSATPITSPDGDDVDMNIDQEWEKPEPKREKKPVDRAKLGRLGTELYLIGLGMYDDETATKYRENEKWRRDAEPTMGEFLEEIDIADSKLLLFFSVAACFGTPLVAARKSREKAAPRNNNLPPVSKPMPGPTTGPAPADDKREPLYHTKD